MTPPMVENPGMETHIHPFKVSSAHNKGHNTNQFLHTSPEFCMKELLSTGDFEKIFTLTYCFRDEPSSEIHRNQFIMLEWYRTQEHYIKIMDDIESLIQFSLEYFKDLNIKTKLSIDHYQRVTVTELFEEYLQLDIFNYLDSKDLKQKILKDYKDIPMPQVECAWDDYFFLLFLNKIEPHLKHISYLLIKEFPAPLAALSTLKKSDSRVCERFEVYLNGIELCNCFNELTDLNEQKRRFKKQNEEKLRLYNYSLPEPQDFYSSLKSGLPESSGVALGVERLLKAMIEVDTPFYR